jgi:hypothetical protein
MLRSELILPLSMVNGSQRLDSSDVLIIIVVIDSDDKMLFDLNSNILCALFNKLGHLRQCAVSVAVICWS